MKNIFPIAVFVLGIVLAGSSSAQNEISEVSFDSIPGGTRFSGGDAIDLQADTNVEGSVTATGQIQAAGGFRFPDSTVQTTAAVGIGTTANIGLYGNTIADFTPPNAYTEICIKGGDVLSDIHAVSEPTTAGNCVPGDLGWVIERFERDAGTQVTWYTARLECLKDGMRLPEPFEWRVACDDAATFAINDMEDSWEWSSNSVEGDLTAGSGAFVSAVIMGNGSCAHGSQGSASSGTGSSTPHEYRCVR